MSYFLTLARHNKFSQQAKHVFNSRAWLQFARGGALIFRIMCFFPGTLVFVIPVFFCKRITFVERRKEL